LERSAGRRHYPVVTLSDPRHYQIATLAGLLVYGTTSLDFEIGVAQAAVMMTAALATQYVGGRLTGLPAFDPRSPLISGLGLCLLLRTNSLGLAALGAVAAIGSKFVLRFRGKHLFNPTNFALVALMLLTDAVWVSPGQWGSVAFAAYLMAGAGGLVVSRAARSDVTIAFAVGYLALVFGRALWLGDPLAIPMHAVQNGALLLFAFHMISDPKTTPDSRPGRVLFALLVAGGAYYVQFVLFRTNGLLWSLALVSCLVPLIDRVVPGDRYHWSRPNAGRAPSLISGVPIHETPHLGAARGGWLGLVGPGRARLLRILRSQG
jgi:hypothetical protein